MKSSLHKHRPLEQCVPVKPVHPTLLIDDIMLISMYKMIAEETIKLVSGIGTKLLYS